MVVDAGARKQVYARTLAPNSLAYKNLNPDQVPSDERFIHRWVHFGFPWFSTMEDLAVFVSLLLNAILYVTAII